MVKAPKKEWYWPLGALQYAAEVHDFFPEEAELLGVITILWNRQELALGRIFVELLDAAKPAYAAAIWERQSTHQNRRDLLALALEAADLTERQKGILSWVIDNTKTVADRRNELIHAEYVVHGRTDQLHAKVKAPRSSKPAKHQKVTAKDLQTVVRDLEHLLAATEAASLELLPPKKLESLEQLRRELKEFRPPQQNPQSD